jgi:hypothetical protein
MLAQPVLPDAHEVTKEPQHHPAVGGALMLKQHVHKDLTASVHGYRQEHVGVAVLVAHRHEGGGLGAQGRQV